MLMATVQSTNVDNVLHMHERFVIFAGVQISEDSGNRHHAYISENDDVLFDRSRQNDFSYHLSSGHKWRRSRI